MTHSPEPWAEDGLSRRSCQDFPASHPEKVSQDELLEAYQRRCAITGCDVEAVLEAAHIIPYRGKETNHPANGLLLRADLHTLFDLGLMTVDPNKVTVLIAPELYGTHYQELDGKPLRSPVGTTNYPSKAALDEHRRKYFLH